MKNFIAPSILSANFAELGKEVDDVILAGADIIHFDVMDNHYVPNLTIGPMVCKSLVDYGVEKPIDVHLMITPGFGGQKFIPESLDKIKKCKDMIDDSGYSIQIEVDGGIGIENIKAVKKAGANMFVAGSAIFNSDNYKDAIKKMKQEISAG